MATAPDSLNTPSPMPPKTLAEVRHEQERFQDVLLLLSDLAKREETTILLILDCLYDVGAVNLVNQKVSLLPANRLLKAIAQFTKPAFKAIAIRWFHKNCPALIADWLQGKVAFEPENPPPVEPPVVAPPGVVAPPEATIVQAETVVEPLALPMAAQTQPDLEEIERLRSRNRWLTGFLIGALSALAGAVLS